MGSITMGRMTGAAVRLWVFICLCTGTAFAQTAFSTQVHVLESEIKLVSQNLAWLELKIKNMKELDQFIPEKLYDSVNYKKSKIASLTALKKRYEKLEALRGKKTAQKTDTRPPDAGKNKSGKAKTVSQTGSGKITPVKQIKDKLRNADLYDWIFVSQKGVRLHLETRLPILFSSGSAKIASGYDSFFKNLAGFLKDKDVRIDVRGYADADPIRSGIYPSNFELGASRAGAVVRKLIGLGIKPSVFRVISTAEHRTDVAQTVIKGKNLQRHVTILIHMLPGNAHS